MNTISFAFTFNTPGDPCPGTWSLGWDGQYWTLVSPWCGLQTWFTLDGFHASAAVPRAVKQRFADIMSRSGLEAAAHAAHGS